jgi:hypothetical protein
VDVKYVIDNYDTEAPSTYPESMRSEAIIISHHNLVDKKQSTIFIPFTHKDDKIVFEAQDAEGFIQDIFS